MLCLTILVLTALWLLSFFGQSIFPSIPLTVTGGFINMLAVVIVVLIMVQFLS